MADSESDVISLNRWRAMLARARQPRRRLELVLSDPAAPALVPQIPEEEFYYLAKAVGSGDISELMQLAAPEQVRACLDFDIWDRDELALERLALWCESLETLPPSRLAALARELDIELLALIFNRAAVIHDRAADEGPEPMRKHPIFETPDGFFIVEFVGRDRELGRVLERFLQRLYNADQDLGRNVLLEARVGLAGELSEVAFRWRSARLADFGFVHEDEAVEVYRHIDPNSVTVPSSVPPATGLPDQPVGLPAVFAESLGDDGLVARVLAAVDDAAQLELLAARLVMLLNRVLSADRVDPSDLDAVAFATARARDTLSLGLEHLTGGDLVRARAALDALPFTTVFRVGFSLLLPLQRRARALRAAGQDDPDLLSVVPPHPEFPRSLDDPPFAGQRPFRTRADLMRVAARLDELEATPRPTA